jgi:integrase/recombinase XerC
MSDAASNTWEEDFFRYLGTERSASALTLRNYRAALQSFRDHMGGRFQQWQECDTDDFRGWLFEMMKANAARATIRLRFAALRSFYK